MLLQRALSNSDADQSPPLMKWYIPITSSISRFLLFQFDEVLASLSSKYRQYQWLIHHFCNTYWECHWKVGAIWWETLWIQDQTIFFFFKLHPVYVCASWFDETCTTPKVFSHFFLVGNIQCPFYLSFTSVLWPCNVIEE